MTIIECVPVPVDTRDPEATTNAYVLGSDPAVLVDPAARTDGLDAAVADRDIAHVAVTHHHPDHVGAVAHYADRHDVTVWARAGREQAFAAATGVSPDRTLRDGSAIPAGGSAISVIETPGHAPEHLAFVLEDTALVGDLAVAEGSVAVAAPEGDLRAYLTSLRRLRAQGFRRLLPGHGPPIDDPDETCERLVRHRLDRERRVERAVAAGARTLDDVVSRAYEKDVSGVRDLARATVRAHLEKLAVEGRLEWDGERARP